MNPRLFQQIAAKLNRDPRRQNGVTAELVATVATGAERTISHPVIQEIRTELMKHRAPKNKRGIVWAYATEVSK